MKWELKEAVFGDMVRVAVGNLYHYGIFAGEDEIWQFGGPPVDLNRDSRDIRVERTDLEGFLAGGFLEVAVPDWRERLKKRFPAQAVAAARSREGEMGYNIIHNNCEHFVYECAYGEKYCSQTQSVRDMWRSMPMVDVYVACFPFDCGKGAILPAERRREIEGCSNEHVRASKTYVWRLLEYGLDRSLGLKLKKLDIRKQENGAWTCPDCCFSLSHAGNVAAVAISRRPVGVDVEQLKPDQFSPRMAQRILTDGERARLAETAPEDEQLFLTKIWTQKESLFKQSGADGFEPGKTETTGAAVNSRLLETPCGQFILTVASPDALLAKVSFPFETGIRVVRPLG